MTIKQWFTIREAAKYLCSSSESVTESDILDLGSSGQLSLCFNFTGYIGIYRNVANHIFLQDAIGTGYFSGYLEPCAITPLESLQKQEVQVGAVRVRSVSYADPIIEDWFKSTDEGIAVRFNHVDHHPIVNGDSPISLENIRINSGDLEAFLHRNVQMNDIVESENRIRNSLTFSEKSKTAPSRLITQFNEPTRGTPANRLIDGEAGKLEAQGIKVTTAVMWMHLGNLVGKSIIIDAQPGTYLCDNGMENSFQLTKNKIRGVLNRRKKRLKEHE